MSHDWDLKNEVNSHVMQHFQGRDNTAFIREALQSLRQNEPMKYKRLEDTALGSQAEHRLNAQCESAAIELENIRQDLAEKHSKTIELGGYTLSFGS